MSEAILVGLGIGGVYAIAALGIIAIHRGTGVLNIAHGAIGMWGAYLFVQARDWFGSGTTAFIFTVLAGAAAGVIFYLVLFKPIRQRPHLSKMVMSIGLLAVLTSLLKLTFDTNNPINVESWLPDQSVDFLGVQVGADRLVLLAIAIVLTVALEIWSSRARLPLVARAASENERGALALGVSPHVVGALMWAIGSALASAVGALIVPIVGLSPGAIGGVLIPALAAALLGRFDDYRIALAGGLVLGVAEAVVTRYVSSPGWGSGVPLILIVIALLLQRDTGGNRLPAQVAPAVASGRFRPIPAALAFFGAGSLIMFANDVYLGSVIFSLCYVLLGLSMTIMLGYGYQMSLAQFAFAGMGALIAAQTSIHWHVPFIVAPLVGALAGGVMGILVGLPALRVRGTNLAVVTLGLGVAIQVIIFNNTTYTGGFLGLAPPSPTVFGIDVNPVLHPQRYAFVVLAWVIVVSCFVYWLRHAPAGRRLLAMRTNERASASIGVDVTRTKLAAFAVSAAIAGLAGVLFAYQQSVISFLDFNSDNSINLVVMSVIAGAGAISGSYVVGIAAVGGVFYQWVGNIPSIQNEYFLIAGVGLCFAVWLNEHGMMVRAKPGSTDSKWKLPEASVEAATGETLEASSVRIAFGGVVAVDDMRVHVSPGEVVGIVGPNGAGKTTFLDVLSGYIRGRGVGKVTIGSHRLDDKATHQRARAGVARGFQAIELFEDLTLGENFLLAAESSNRNGRGFPKSAAQACTRFGLDGLMNQRPSGLSLAQRSLAGVVRAMAINPSVLLLDEPGAGLSRKESLDLAGEIRQFAADYGIGVLLIDHDMGLVTASCDRLVVMAGGAHLAEGEPGEVLRNQQVRDVYLGESPVVVLDQQDGTLARVND
jgi:ABC-type branched-subunit amino acid transport system ATPase component/ABC-type branched-subunit amino acid transport system permease subunit